MTRYSRFIALTKKEKLKGNLLNTLEIFEINLYIELKFQLKQ